MNDTSQPANDAAVSDWDAGYSFDEPPDAITPTSVTPPVTRVVTGPVTETATTVDTGGVTWRGGEPVTQAGPDAADPLRVGEWGPQPDEAGRERDGGFADVITRLGVLFRSPLLGGGPEGLAAQFKDPKPGTLGQHWEHVLQHPGMPEGPWAAIGFVAGHLVVTGPLKLTGKAMSGTGNALTWTGARIDRVSDRFTSAVIFLALSAAIVAAIVIALGDVISNLP